MIANPYSYPNTPIQYSPTKSDPDTEAEEVENIPPVPQSTHLRKEATQKGTKIKSSLCKNYLLFGSCPYGQRCQFAHGPHELRCNTISNTSYKTKPCFSYLNKGYCPYGHRCNFIHKSLNPCEEYTFATKFQNFPEMAHMLGSSHIGSRLLFGLGFKQGQ